MKRLGLVLMATVGFAGLAHAADVPTKKAPEPAPAAKPNCWGNYGWDWLKSSADDCPLSYAGITLYGTLDVGLGYQQYGTRFNPSADKLNYGIQKSSHQEPLPADLQRNEHLGGRPEDEGRPRPGRPAGMVAGRRP